MAKYLDLSGLTTFINLVKNTFVYKDEVTNYTNETKEFVTEVDYELLKFDTKECYRNYVEEKNDV